MENSKKELKMEEMDKVAAGEDMENIGSEHPMGIIGIVWKKPDGEIYEKWFAPEKKLD